MLCYSVSHAPPNSRDIAYKSGPQIFRKIKESNIKIFLPFSFLIRLTNDVNVIIIMFKGQQMFRWLCASVKNLVISTFIVLLLLHKQILRIKVFFFVSFKTVGRASIVKTFHFQRTVHFMIRERERTPRFVYHNPA